MILPTKQLKPENSLIYLGGAALSLLDEPKTVSRLWHDFQQDRVRSIMAPNCDVPFEWFVLALDLLHLTGALEFRYGRLERGSR